jgi:hypothetical protein
MRSRDSVVGIATRYGLEGLGIETRWGEIFRTYPDRLRGPPSLLYNGYRVFPGGKVDRDVMLTTHPLLVPRLRKSWAIPPLTLWVLLGLLRVPFTLYLYQHMHNNILMKFHYRVSCNMFRPLIWPSSGWYNQEYNLKYKIVGIIPTLKIFVSNYMDHIKII